MWPRADARLSMLGALSGQGHPFRALSLLACPGLTPPLLPDPALPHLTLSLNLSQSQSICLSVFLPLPLSLYSVAATVMLPGLKGLGGEAEGVT